MKLLIILIDENTKLAFVLRMLTGNQIRAARALLDLSQAQLGKLAGISIPRIYAIENGGDCLQSTATAIRDVLESRGAEFFRDGGVRAVPKDEDFIVPHSQNPDDATLRAAKAVVAAYDKARAFRGE